MKNNNPLLNIVFNIILPLIILTKLSKEEYLGPFWGLIFALAFPIILGLYDLIVNKQKSIFSIIGFIGILFTGVIGLMKFSPQWIAIKEALIPLILGLIVLFSTNKSWQLISLVLYNREIFDIDKIEKNLEPKGFLIQLKKKLTIANIFFSFSFFFSSVLNFLLARIIVQSMPGTMQFNEEIGQMTMLSFPLIALPSIIIMIFIFRYILITIKKLTQLETNEILSPKLKNEK